MKNQKNVIYSSTQDFFAIFKKNYYAILVL